MAKILALANHKGGVCKTFLSVNMADAFAREGLEVLLVDLDPQGHATALAYSFEAVPSTPIERVLTGEAGMAEAIVTQNRIPGVHLLGATLKLSNIEQQLQMRRFGSPRMLADKLKPVGDAYDVIILDCPPSLGLLTANALAAADMVLVPIQSGAKLSLVGSDDMYSFIEEGREVNPRLRFGGAVLTKHDGRKKVCQIIAGSVAARYTDVFESTIPESTDVEKAVLLGQTILQFDCDHTVSRKVVSLTREVMAKLGLQSKSRVPA